MIICLSVCSFICSGYIIGASSSVCIIGIYVLANVFGNLFCVLQSMEIDKQFLAAPVKSAVDKFQLLPEFLKVMLKIVTIL